MTVGQMTDAIDLTNVLLAIIGVFGGVIVWGLKGLSMRVLTKLNEVDLRQMDCSRRFADAEHNTETHARIFKEVEELEKRVTAIEAKLLK